MNSEAFAKACEKVIGRQRKRKGIGVLSEKTLHAVMKEYYEPDSENHEVRVGSYVADIVGEKGIIEIQTSNFKYLIPKLDVFLEYCDVTVVYPMAAVKYLIWMDTETGELSPKRRSPKKMCIYDAAREMYVLRYALDNPRFHLRLCMLELEEIRYLNGKRQRGNPKKGSTRCDRIPTALLGEIAFDCPDDYRQLIPDGLSGEFDCKSFAKLAATDLNNARMIVKILVYLGFAVLVRKEKRTNIYRIK